MATDKRVFSLEAPHGTSGVHFIWQKTAGGYLVTTGYNQTVNVYDRHGALKEILPLPGLCSGFGWDKDGALLAIINDRSPLIHIWNANSGQMQHLDSGLRDVLTYITWSKTAPLLAVGTAKGNLMIYNRQSSRRIPVVGKHSKKIQSGAWSHEGLLALGGEDKMLTISNSDGDTLRSAPLRGEPYDIQFSEMKTDERSMGQNTVSLIISRKTLFLYNLNDPENPIELAFQSKYGGIVAYKWFGDGYILLGFSSGFFIVISTHMKEIGQELFQAKNHRESLTDIAVSKTLSKAASCGDNVIKIHELTDLKETSGVITLDDEKGISWMEWSEDGQLLAVATPTGNVHVYLTKLPVLGTASGTRIAYLTSLLEVTVISAIDKETLITLTVDVEPSFLAIGSYHLIVGMNNRAWMYSLGDDEAVFLRDREYLGAVTSVRISSDYVSVLYEGKIQFHLIEGETGEDEERESILFPTSDQENVVITDHALTNDFLIYSADNGSLFFFFIEDWKALSDYRHTNGIKNIFCESSGRKLIIIDSKGEGFIYNPVNDDLFSIPNFPPGCNKCLWESSAPERHIFVLFNQKELFTYVFHQEHIEGPHIVMVGKTKIPQGQIPLLVHSGEVTLQTSSGKTATLVLSSHEMETNIHDYSPEQHKVTLSKNIALRRFKDAFAICQVLNSNEDWEKLADACIRCMNVQLAIRIYRQLGNVGLVWSLQELQDIEDPMLVAGHLAMFLSDFTRAQELYLKSNTPVAALEMRRDLLHWDQALQLAKKLGPDQIPFISREYAQQLEFTGDYPGALTHYERAIVNESGFEDHNIASKAGIARMSLRCGDIRRGTNIATEMNNRQLKKECAEILESKKYAKAREHEGQYKEAVAAYEAAQDYDSVVRLYLNKLNAPEEAVRVVRETKSAEGAKMVSKFFQRLNDYGSAIQFLVMSKCNEEAFQMARAHGKMELYADILGNDATPEEYKSLAVHFENEKQYYLAGKYNYLGGNYSKALKLLLRASGSSGGEDMEPLQLAIDVAAAANDDNLTKQLIDFLMGEVDGVPKDPKLLFRLYMARKHYKEAAKTAVIIAREEQNLGNYRHAHDVLLGMCKELRKQKLNIPADMSAALLLLHSYALARLFVRQGDHTKAARMLVRVANNISKFPAHTVPILTSAVIECQRAGLKNSSFNFAVILLRPETRSKIDEKYKKKIEAIVRRPQKTEVDEESFPCPYCKVAVLQTELECNQCKNNLPYCVATGWHILADDFTICPSCQFPAIQSHFAKLMESGEACPMCSTKVSLEQIQKIDKWMDALAYKI